MDEATQPRLCEVCGGPLQRNNTTGICRRTPECNRRQTEKRRREQGVRPRGSRRPGCSVEGCPKPHYGNGYCAAHNARVKRTGSPGGSLRKSRLSAIHAGDTFKRWTVLEDYAGHGKPIPCRCECGTERAVLGESLLDGRSGSCGCLQRKIVSLPRSSEPYLPVGAKYGRLTVLTEAWYTFDTVTCLCECGTETAKKAEHVKRGATRSCGCLRRETLRTHGLSGHPLYMTWTGMVARTSDPRNVGYASYGGRGIKVCERWQGLPDGLLNFAADVGERPKGMTLDRIDNDGDYEPSNVQWATPKQQNDNRRSVVALTRERDELLAIIQEQARALAKRPRRQPVAGSPAVDVLF